MVKRTQYADFLSQHFERIIRDTAWAYLAYLESRFYRM